MSERLPDDPDFWNEARASWAQFALTAFQTKTGTDSEDALPELLCDLMHWCDWNTGDFETALSKARSYYKDETDRGDYAAEDESHVRV